MLIFLHYIFISIFQVTYIVKLASDWISDLTTCIHCGVGHRDLLREKENVTSEERNGHSSKRRREGRTYNLHTAKRHRQPYKVSSYTSHSFILSQIYNTGHTTWVAHTKSERLYELALTLDMYADTAVYISLHTILSSSFRFSQESLDLTPDPATNRDGKQPLSWSVSAPQYGNTSAAV